MSAIVNVIVSYLSRPVRREGRTATYGVSHQSDAQGDRTAPVLPILPGVPEKQTHDTAWLEVVLTAVDLITWTKLIAFADTPTLARCEIAAFRYRVLHVAARITRGARRTRLRIDATWRWATQIAEGFHRLRAAFA
jgi:hypothetical protein